MALAERWNLEQSENELVGLGFELLRLTELAQEKRRTVGVGNLETKEDQNRLT
jgi:hypothetical protein